MDTSITHSVQLMLLAAGARRSASRFLHGCGRCGRSHSSARRRICGGGRRGEASSARLGDGDRRRECQRHGAIWAVLPGPPSLPLHGLRARRHHNVGCDGGRNGLVDGGGIAGRRERHSDVLLETTSHHAERLSARYQPCLRSS